MTEFDRHLTDKIIKSHKNTEKVIKRDCLENRIKSAFVRKVRKSDQTSKAVREAEAASSNLVTPTRSETFNYQGFRAFSFIRFLSSKILKKSILTDF